MFIDFLAVLFEFTISIFIVMSYLTIHDFFLKYCGGLQSQCCCFLPGSYYQNLSPSNFLCYFFLTFSIILEYSSMKLPILRRRCLLWFLEQPDTLHTDSLNITKFKHAKFEKKKKFTPKKCIRQQCTVLHCSVHSTLEHWWPIPNCFVI